MKNLVFRFAALVIIIYCIQSFVFINNANAFVAWTIPSGSAVNFDWENGGSDNGLFGNPVIIGENIFAFFPQNFRADSLNGQSAEVSDTLSFDLIAHSNALITGIQISEYGDYGILGSGFVNMYGALQAENLVTSETEYANLIPTPLMPVYSDTGEAVWTADGAVSFNNGWTHLRVTLSSNLLTISDPGSVTFIQEKIVGDSVAITIIPEPATLIVLAAGILCLKIKNRNGRKI